MVKRKAGGYEWRAEIENAIISEQNEVKTIQALLDAAQNAAAAKLLADLLASKIERLRILYELRDYRG